MFKTVKRIIDWCGEFKGKLYLGFIFSFFSYWFAAMPVMVAAYTIGMLLDAGRGAGTFDRAWIWKSLVIMGVFVFLRFLFDYLRARCQEAISYELIARDRLAVGDALKRVSLGYFAQMNTGNILNSITTGLGTLENMGIRMIDNFVGGYLNFLCIFLFLLFFNPVVSLIALAGAFASFLCLLLVSKHSVKHTPAEAEAGRNLAGAVLEYARGISVVKSFGKSGASMEAMQKACRDSRDIRLAIEWGFTPANCLHLLALKCASVALAAEACFLGFRGEMEFPVMLMFVFFPFGIFGSLEPISDSAHVLGVIDEAMGQLDELKQDHFIDENGTDIPLTNYDIAFSDVSFGYDSRTILKGVSFRIPEHTTTAIVGPSGSGKTTMVLEMLMPALQSRIDRSPQPTQVRLLEADGVSKAHLIDATPIGANIRSTVATYCGVHDDLRRAFAKTDAARTIGLKAGAFSYNTGKLRCATCDGTGSISLDVQFLPDVDIECPACHGSRYSDAIAELKLPCTDGVAYSMPQLMTMTVDDAMPVLRDVKPIQTKLATLHELGLGYLALGEPTPALSGGEAQRLKLASEMGRKQHDAVFVFDEPTIGLHPLDVRVLLHVFDELVANGATVVVIEHDLDVIANADYVVDMGPGGGEAGGRVVCEGAPSRIAACPESVTGRYLQSSQC